MLRSSKVVDKDGRGDFLTLQEAIDAVPDYLKNVVNMTDETKFYYLPNQGYSGAIGSWMNYQTDEFNINGEFDFTMKLPPPQEPRRLGRL